MTLSAVKNGFLPCMNLNMRGYKVLLVPNSCHGKITIFLIHLTTS